MIRTLTTLLAFVLTAGCASLHRTPIPNWERYQQGDLAGFLRAPGEQVVEGPGLRSVPPRALVQRARGEIWVPGVGGPHGRPTGTGEPQTTGVMAMQPVSPGAVISGEIANPYATRFFPGSSPRPPAYIEPTLVVVELRGPGTSHEVRTLVSRDRTFDFGRLPEGTYTLKATMDRGSVVDTIAVSHTADGAAWLRIRLPY